VNPVPVSLCRALGAEVVIAVDLGWAKLGRHRASAEAAMPSVLEVFVTSMDIMQVRAARSRLAGEPADALVTPLLPGFGTMEFHRAREAIDEGRAAVQRMLPLIRQVLED
jgi:NTE family protein